MKKTISMLAVLLLTIGIVSATTTVDTTWSGSGNLDTHFVSGNDAHSDFWTGGSVIWGNYKATDVDDNPHSYGVDTTYSSVDAGISGGGFLKFQNQRDDSKVSAYGNAGQNSYSYISTLDGTAEMAWYSWTNYAEMANCEYGTGKPKTTSGKNFEASGSNYHMYHTLTDADGDGAYFEGYGSGSAMVKLQGEKSGGTSSYFNMGSLPICGDGCAWNNNYATYSGTGSGDFEVHGWADNGLTVGCPTCGNGFTIPGDGSDNSATYDLHVGYSGTWSNSNFGVAGN